MDNLPGGPPSRDPRLDLRVSHADREAVAEHLRQAAGDGRLDMDELEQRLDLAFSAKTYGDLDPLLADLPGHARQGPQQAAPATHSGWTTQIGGTATSDRAQAILSEQRRQGAWVVPAHYTATAVLGSVLLDLREASFAAREVRISCTAFLGEVKIRVAPDVTVVHDVSAVLADAVQRSSRDLPPVPQGGPVVRVTGTAVLGDITVERLAPGQRGVRRWHRGPIQP